MAPYPDHGRLSGRHPLTDLEHDAACLPVARVVDVVVALWQYKNVRPDYVKAIWKVANWKDVEARYVAAGGGK